MSQRPPFGILPLFVITLLLAPALLSSPVGAEGASPREPGTNAPPRFLDVGATGVGDQTVRLAVPYTPSANPPPGSVEKVGYREVVLGASSQMIPAAGLNALVASAARCASTSNATSVEPTCQPLTRASSCATAPSATAYCVTVDPSTDTVRVMLVGHSAVLIKLVVAKQPTEGTLEGAVSVNFANSAWSASAPAPRYPVPFTTAPTPIAKILVRNAAGGAGAEVLTIDTTTDPLHTLFAAGYDAEDRFVADQPTATWSIRDSKIGTLSPTTGASTTFDPRGVGATTLAVSASGFSVTIPVSVTAGVPASLIVRDSAGGQGAAIAARSLTSDEFLNVHAAGYDADNNWAGDQAATWSVSGAPAPCGTILADGDLHAVFDAKRTRTTSCRITATAGTMSATTGLITVTHGEWANLTLWYGSTNVTVDDVSMTTQGELKVTAVSFDRELNLVNPDVLWGVHGDCGKLNRTAGPSVTFDATRVTTGDQCRIGAMPHEAVAGVAAPTSKGNVSAGKSAWTGFISVAAGPATHVKIRTQPNNGGIEAGAFSFTTDDTPTFYAAGYDGDFNYVGDLAAAQWSIDEPSLATVTAASGASTTINLDKLGNVIVSVAAGSAGDATGVITITAGRLAAITIRDAANGAGAVVDDFTQPAGTSRTVFAAGYDAKTNLLGDVDATWSVDDPCGTVVAGPAKQTSFTAGQVARENCRVRATVGSVIGLTGLISLTTPQISSLLIRDADGSDVGAFTRSAGHPITLKAAGFNGAGAFVGNQSSAAWAVLGTPACGSLSAPTGASVVFTPTKTGTTDCTVTAAVGAISDETGLVTVNPGITHHITVSSVPTTLVAGAAFPNDIVVSVFDAYDNLNTSYADKVRVTISDKVNSGAAAETVPADHTYLTTEMGTHTYPTSSFVVRKTGARTLTFAAVVGTVVATSTMTFPIAVSPATLKDFTVTGASFDKVGTSSQDPVAVAGEPRTGNVIVTARDLYQNVKTDHVGTVTFSTEDPAATVPPAATFASADQGVITVPASGITWRTAGPQRLTAADSVLAAATGQSGNVRVDAAAAKEFVVVSGPASSTAGATFTMQIKAVDEFGNTLVSKTGPAEANPYTGVKTLRISGANPAYDGTAPTARGSGRTEQLDVAFGTNTAATFANGAATLTMKLYRREAAAIVVEGNALQNVPHVINVAAAAPHQLGILVDCMASANDRSCVVASESVTAPWKPTIGVTHTLRSAAMDQYDNIVGSETAAWVSSSTDAQHVAFVASNSEFGFQAKSTTKATVTVSQNGLVAAKFEVEPTA